MRIAIVQGTRPEIIKNYSIVKALRSSGASFEVFHTNQHFSPRMCRNMYEDMEYAPDRVLAEDYRLGVAIDWLQNMFAKDRISHVLVNGDTAASLAGALAAMYMDIEVSHVEAGLRSGDTLMREERNRIMVDSIAHRLFAYTSYEEDALRNMHGIRGDVYLEGNTTVDVLNDFPRPIGRRLASGTYIYATLHRKEFTDSRERMADVLSALSWVAREICPVIFPIHPRTRDALRKHGLGDEILGEAQVSDPVSTFESLSLQKHAAAVLTDSGCVQEEAYLLGVPCITVRENTERHLTVQHGANTLTGFVPARILAGIRWALSVTDRKWPPIYGCIGAGDRIVSRILSDSAKLSPETYLETA
jgi:UDP-N-acetylglucosamine 2-epimerase (non-hydrolysing)